MTAGEEPEPRAGTANTTGAGAAVTPGPSPGAANSPGAGARTANAPGATSGRAWSRRAIGFVFGPTEAGRLQLFRALFAVALLCYVGFRWQFAAEWLTAAGYHPSGAASGGFQQPVPLLPAGALRWFGAAYFMAIVALVAGIRPRVTIWLVLAGTMYVTAADRLAAFTINKIFVGGLLILALAPPIVSGPDGRPLIRAAWPLRALQFTLIVQLFGAGICKVRFGDWLAHGDTLWHQVQLNFMTDAAAWMVRTLPMPVWTALQHLALGFELAAPVLFMVRRLRPLGYVLGLGMFAMISLTMRELIFFALQMCSFFVLFVDEDRLWWARRRLARRLSR